uniref:CHAT domain-containing protein n=1 Tax=Eiseniibacteriota bacterium TaxID=2212470 RepID=A0A832I4V2_UNCEI
MARGRAAGDALLERRALLKRGAYGIFDGRADDAARDGARAESLAVAARDDADLRAALRVRGLALLDAERHGEARPVFERLLALGRRARQPDDEGTALRGLAYLDLEAGRWGLARARYRLSLERLRGTPHRYGWLTARIGLARAHAQGFAAWDSARAIYDEVVEEARAGGFAELEAQACNNLGALEWAAGDPSRAAALWRRVVALRAARSPAQGVVPAANLSVALTYLGRYDEAAEVLEEVRARLAPSAPAGRRALLLTQLALVRARQGRASEAAALHRQAVALAAGLPAEQADGHCDPAAGHVLRTAGPRAALDSLAAWRARRRGDAWPVGAAAEAAAWLALGRGHEALAALAALPPAGPRDHALEGIRRGLLASRAHRAAGDRARAAAAARAAVEAWERLRTATRDPAWREAHGPSARVFALHLAALAMDGASGPDARARAAFDAVQRFRARTLAERMSGAAETARPLPRDVRADSLQRAVLRPGEVLLDYVAHHDSTLVVALARDRARAAWLPGDATLRPRVSAFLDVVAPSALDGRPLAAATPAAEAARAAAAGLGAIAFSGVAEMVASARRVIVVADGALAAVPFALLADPATGRALAERAEVVHAPSAAFLSAARARRAPQATPPARILALAGPVADGDRPLPGAAEELAWLARRFAGVVARPAGSLAGLGTAARALAGGDVLHIAAHTETAPGAPWRTGVRLAAPAGREPFVLRAADVARLRLRGRLVVLSGCGTYGTTGGAAEAPQGLATAFLAAGVPTAVATMWPVADRTAARFTEAFYERLARGLDAGAALRGAQAELRAHGAAREPHAWAAFTLVGDPGTRVTLAPAGRVTGGGFGSLSRW